MYGTDQGAFSERVSDARGGRLVGGDEGGEERVGDRRVEEETTGGGAALAGGSECGEGDGGQSKSEVGVGQNDGGLWSVREESAFKSGEEWS